MPYSDFIDQRDLNRIEDFSTERHEYFTFIEFEKIMKKFPPFDSVDILFCGDNTVVLLSQRRASYIKITQSGIVDISMLEGINIVKTEKIINIPDDIKKIFSLLYLHILFNY